MSVWRERSGGVGDWENQSTQFVMSSSTEPGWRRGVVLDAGFERRGDLQSGVAPLSFCGPTGNVHSLPRPTMPSRVRGLPPEICLGTWLDQQAGPN